MKLHLTFLFVIQILFYSNSLFSQSGKPSISKEPSWISQNIIDYSRTSLDKYAADGYIDISCEKQISLADKSEYVRRSKKIISQAGVQNASEISVSFDPSYEQLIFHSIHIIRNGEILNRLQLSKIKTVHQEKELTNFIYNGLLNAILILEDVRQGDIIEYSYTIKGFNPIFKNKYAEVYSMEYGVPVYEIYYKLIVPSERKMSFKNLNLTLQPVTTSINGQQVYEWHRKNVSPIILQDYTPSWYDPYAKILVSEFNSWKEVNDLEMELFPLKKLLSQALLKKIKEIQTTYNTDDERAQRALRFVQDDIRYMGIEMGENSHRPADPSKVFAQRFGDCKEKSYLLCCILNALGIEANPVLINTDIKKNISTLLPALTDFDHVTVRVKLGNVYYWFDPTIAYQRGNIKNLFYPDYQAGLVISDTTASLTSIGFRNISSLHVQDYFTVRSMFGGGYLKVVSVFQGSTADEQRNNFNNQSISELMTSYQKFYASYYEDIKADSLTYTDNDSTGIFITTEYYHIPNFWTEDKSKGNKFSFSPFIINNILRRPKEKDRTMPFKLLFPAKYQEDITVDLPQNWKVTEDETHLKNASYACNSKFYCVDNKVRLITEYENFRDNVTIDEASNYFRDLNKYDKIASFEISLGGEEGSNSSPKTGNKNILSTILLLGVITGGFIWWNKRK